MPKLKREKCSKKKNFLEIYMGPNDAGAKKVDFSYYVNIESTILELLLDNNLESYTNAGKLLFIVLSGLSAKVLYIKRILNLIHLFFYKGGQKFYHSDLHLSVLVFLQSNVKMYYSKFSLYIYNLLLSNNDLHGIEINKNKFVPKHCICTLSDYLYFYIKDFMILARNIIYDEVGSKIEMNNKNYMTMDNKLKGGRSYKDNLKNETKKKKKIVLYNENDEEVMHNFWKIFKYSFPKSIEKSFKDLISQCPQINYSLHSIYLDIYVLINIKNVIKVIILIDQLLTSDFPYYYFYEIKLKLLLLYIHTYYKKYFFDDNSICVGIKEDEKGSNFIISNKSSKASNLKYVDISKNINNEDVMENENNMDILSEEKVKYGTKINENKKNSDELNDINQFVNDDIYSLCSNSNKSSEKGDIYVDTESNTLEFYNNSLDNNKHIYLDNFMKMYINNTENDISSLPSISDFHDNNLLNKLKIKSKQCKMDYDPSSLLGNLSKDEIKKVNEQATKNNLEIKDGIDSHNNNTYEKEDYDISIGKKEGKNDKRFNSENVQNINKNTYNDIMYNINIIENVAKSLLIKSCYDPIYLKLFYSYLLPFISFNKRIEIFLIYSHANYKLIKPLIFIIFYNNYGSEFILNTFNIIFKNQNLFQMYKNAYFNELSLKNITKTYFIFLMLLSVFFYNNPMESMLYIFKLFYKYDKEIINDQEGDIDYKKIYEDVILENDEKYVEEKKYINIMIIKFIEIYQEKFNIYLCNYFDFYRIYFILFVSCVDINKEAL
ncbi:conserved Plasmodium protein, unknown function [Plasmodium berghei]|uniref:Uncharacterized protein n=2 Tax=Plasmodium berghei TaxID=5821 RepID=A0A509ALM2_PLABA|nr:conserved Plasmodium protein, unknown function [Plasmodium berghei ANKA]CXI74401.1 conserved Plasmodium protein, unknown function [Plasmodium berghei]SCM24684.1 conserved Plasmodium protein, unknown function [Plasmodium berghei]SCN27139.1 conserved Plasmodium protein, unknown function [Plasmodium berghei]SCO61665.1 conserved Plasmodium protein, unknown function [Plasmodium berghei]SCO63562.1 conserved Plasmodium protein, unknown function [Plasmodium berghei]|eukprot:XP_034422773.1 conserved Plasmodium protein, unknown function [Plasmodium berghei ANKA]